MGFKRPIEDNDVNEFPLKHPKQVIFGDDLTSFSQNFPNFEETQKTNKPGEDDLYYKFQSDGSDIDKDDTESVPEYVSPFSPEYMDFHFPRTIVPQLEDTYSSLLEGPPKKQVPIGTDHQAVFPEWDPQTIFNDCVEKFMGICVHQPDVKLCAQSDDVALHVWKDRICLDKGSIQCVQQRIKESREALRITLGDEKFEKLGFCDMGEDVSEKWSEEEERIIHQVVYTKDVSNTKNFWDNLSIVFPTRKKSEIVNYYFNVFILRRRFVQNRSKFLDIDSDDDDWDESYWCPGGFEQEGDDLPINGDVGKNGGESTNGLGSGFALEPCNAKLWDDNYQMSPLKFFDNPTTGDNMDDLFGPCGKNNGPDL